MGDTYVSIEQYNGSAERHLGRQEPAGRPLRRWRRRRLPLWRHQGDWLQGGRGADYINGGAGFDMVSYADAAYGITAEMYFDGEASAPPKARSWPASGAPTRSSASRMSRAPHFGDYLIGDERANTFWGLGGADRFEGDSGSTPAGLLGRHVRRQRQ